MFVRVCKDHVNEGMSKIGRDSCTITRRVKKYANAPCFYCGKEEDYILSCLDMDED
jgi:hypothetical protein